MNAKAPRVTGIIPTFNRAHLICDAIDSALNQTRPIDELIIIDDGSTDNTAEVLQRYGDRIRYIRQPNAGPSAARNHALREATGDFIAFLDSDDLWVPSKIQLQLEFLAKHPDIDLVFGKDESVWPSPIAHQVQLKGRSLYRYVQENAARLDGIVDCLIEMNIISTPTVMVRRSSLQQVGFFNETLRWCEDYELWLRATRHCRFGYVDELLLTRRRHGDNLVNDWAAWNLRLIHVLGRIPELIPDLPARAYARLTERTKELHYDVGSHFLKRRDYRSAFAHFRDSNPANLKPSKWPLTAKWATKYALTFLLGGFRASATA